MFYVGFSFKSLDLCILSVVVLEFNKLERNCWWGGERKVRKWGYQNIGDVKGKGEIVRKEG